MFPSSFLRTALALYQSNGSSNKLTKYTLKPGKSSERHTIYQGDTLKYLERIEGLINAYDFDPNDGPTLPIVMWLMKSWEIGDSMVSLSKTRSEHSLFILLRPLMEYCARAKYVSLSPEDRYGRFVRAEARAEIKKCEEDVDRIELLEAVLEKIGEGPGIPDFKGMLGKIGHEALYVEYQKLSKFTHGSIHELYKHSMLKGERSQGLIMLQEPNHDEKELLWYLTAYFLNMGAEALESCSLALDSET